MKQLAHGWSMPDMLLLNGSRRGQFAMSPWRVHPFQRGSDVVGYMQGPQRRRNVLRRQSISRRAVMATASNEAVGCGGAGRSRPGGWCWKSPSSGKAGFAKCGGSGLPRVDPTIAWRPRADREQSRIERSICDQRRGSERTCGCPFDGRLRIHAAATICCRTKVLGTGQVRGSFSPLRVHCERGSSSIPRLSPNRLPIVSPTKMQDHAVGVGNDG